LGDLVLKLSRYKKLRVWQVNQRCLKICLELFNLDKSYSYQHIAKQLFRSISSIGANIAEGHESYVGKEYLRYIDISIRSSIESDHWIETLKNLYPNYEADLNLLSNLNLEVIKMLQGLKKSIQIKRTYDNNSKL
jgi:four helix bundle protein